MATDNSELVFYRSVRTYRDGRTLVVLLFCGLIAGFFGTAVIRDNLTHQPVSTPATIVSIVFGFIFVAGLRKMLEGTKEKVELTTEGVLARGKTWSWDTIARIGKMRISFSENVWIKVEVRTQLGGTRGLCVLQGEKPLTPAEYAAIANRVKEFAQEKYPQVEIEA
jgi:hypothetical protein